MRLKDFVEKYQLKVITAGELPDREVEGCYIGDQMCIRDRDRGLQNQPVIVEEGKKRIECRPRTVGCDPPDR